MPSDVLADISLARRLERTEATANARFVEARARLQPASRAEWIEVAGAYAMFDGPRSPCTQTFGLGLFEIPAAADLDKLEAFFKEREAPVFHEVSPLADKALWPMLHERSYRPVEFTSVMFLPLDGRASPAAALSGTLRVRVVGKEERDVWARTAAEGWSEFTEIAGLMNDLMRVNAEKEGGVSLLVDLDGQPIATGGLAIHDGAALFAGASTIAQWRRHGAQRLLVDSRLQYARQAGCELAMFCATPGSTSQRNAERQGFRIAYTRVKFGLQA